MRTLLYCTLVCVLGLPALSACGQKGPLFLAPKRTQPVVVPSPAAEPPAPPAADDPS